jgi:hypothetical protein
MIRPCQNAGVTDDLLAETIAVLRGAGARFALLHGSRVAGTHRPDSDVDVAAWWQRSSWPVSPIPEICGSSSPP